MSEAIKPTFFNDFSSLEVFKEAEKKEKDPEAESLAIMKTSDGWHIVKDLIDRTITELDQMLLVKMANGSQLDQIGQLAITNQLIKDVLNRIKSRVEDTPDR
jgi:hypothetical protein